MPWPDQDLIANFHQHRPGELIVRSGRPGALPCGPHQVAITARAIHRSLAVMARGQIRQSMTARTLVTIGLLTICFNAWGQDSLNYQGQPFQIRDLPTKMKTEQPLFIIKSDGKTCNVPATGRFSNQRQVRRTFKKFNTDSVQSIDVIKGKDATDKYGALGQYGVIILNLKDGTYDTLPSKMKRGCG